MNSTAMTADMQREMTMQLKVLERRDEAEGVISLALGSLDGARLPDWEPGAHIDVVLDDDLIRQYSLCGPTNAEGYWRIAVLREPSSRGGSRTIHDTIDRGAQLTVRGPRNNFALSPAPRFLFIAGGIGITPILPMVRQAAAVGAEWTLLYGGRTRSSMAFMEELLDMPGGEVMICPEDEVGLLDLAAHLEVPQEETLVYCCGPEPLIRTVEEHCARWPRKSLHTERFVASRRPLNSGDGSFVVELARSGQRLAVGAHESMLDVLEAEGCDITNSCRAGICGTCLTNVVDGEPEHLDDVLGDDERESNSVVLPCVSRSRTEVLVLDL